MTNLRALRELVDSQAEDEGLWFVARTAPEAYLQQELRKLHALIEECSDEPSAAPHTCEARGYNPLIDTPCPVCAEEAAAYLERRPVKSTVSWPLDYVCPQCGPDPRGPDVHALEHHVLR